MDYASLEARSPSPRRTESGSQCTNHLPAPAGLRFQVRFSTSTTTRRPTIASTLGIEQLVQQIRETADKLIRDRANRGDVKLLSTALKELRYCFKVFAPLSAAAQGDGVRLGPAAG